MNHWIWSDPHIGHVNLKGGGILQFCNRPFKDITEMERFFDKKIRTTIQPDDICWCLGDFGFGNKAFTERMHTMVKSWPGTHIVIRGNHDRKHSRLMRMGFAASIDYVEIVHNGLRIAMTHRPRYEKPEGVDLVLHGHVHNATYKGMIDGNEPPIIPLWNVNMCVDVTDYAPQTMEYAIKRWRRQNKK